MKTCSKCGQSKALEEFFRNKSAPDGRRSHCKACHQATKYDTCECGARKWGRSALCKSCSAEAAHGVDRVATPSVTGGRTRARARFTLSQCEYENCDKAAMDRHHIDGNTANNAPENIARLCRYHHMFLDGRLSQLAAQAGYAGSLGGWPKQKRNLEDAA